MLSIRKTFITIITSFLFVCSLIAQEPPARTWYANKYGEKITVKERWSEDAQGLKHGTYIKYFSGGDREILGYYNHGKKNGQWEELSVYEVLLSTFQYMEYTTYTNDIKNGLYKRVNVSTGVVFIQGNFSNGIQSGYWKDGYDEKDKVYREGNIVNNEREGEWKNTFAEFGSVDVTTKKGYRTVFENGKCIKCYDNNGVDLAAKVRQKSIDEQIDSEFSKCYSIEDYQNFKTKYPNTKWSGYADNRIEELKYITPLINRWNSMTYKERSLTFFDGYFTKYPNGFNNYEVKELLKEYSYKLYLLSPSLETLAKYSKYSNSALRDYNELLILSKKCNSANDTTVFISFSGSENVVAKQQITLQIFKGIGVNINISYFDYVNETEILINKNWFRLTNSYSSRVDKGFGKILVKYWVDEYYDIRTFDVHGLDSILIYDKLSSNAICNCNRTNDFNFHIEDEGLIFKSIKDYSKSPCYLRLANFYGYTTTINNIYSDILMYNTITDVRIRNYLFNGKQSVYLLNNNNSKSSTTSLIFAYYLWLDGKFEQAKNVIVKIKESNIPITITISDFKYSYSLADYISQVHKIHIKQYFGSGFPNEKDFLKMIKSIE